MIGFCEKTLSLTDGMERGAFFADERTYPGALYYIALIGESATSVPQEIRDANPHIPWGDIIGARHRVIHGYDRINEDAVWEIVQTGVPDLLPQLRELIGDE